MGKPISAVAGVSSAIPTASTTQSSPAQSPTQSPVQSPEQSSPVATEPKKFWPPAYGWRLSALGGDRVSHNGWQAQWLQHGSAIAGGGAVDSVAELKPKLNPHLSHGSHGRWS